MGSRDERALLTRQLSRNARQLGLLFEDEPTEAATYFDRRYFNQHQPAAPGSLPVKPLPTPS